MKMNQNMKFRLNIKRTVIRLVLPLMALLLPAACTKDFLDRKSDKSLLVPQTLADFQALLDNLNTMTPAPGFNLISSDDFYNIDGLAALVTARERNAYLWAKDVYQGAASITDWSTPYQQVFYANIVLDNLDEVRVTPENQATWNRIKGSALFYRAYAHFNLAGEFCRPYTPGGDNSGPGIPIRLTSDVNVISERRTVDYTYARIISDLKEARDLLPYAPGIKSRPSGAAADAMLARVYLAMGDYTNALTSASACLQQFSALLDFNRLDTASATPLPRPLSAGNDEVIFYSTALQFSFSVSAYTLGDSVLLGAYAPGDLRRKIFFNAKGNYKGSYTGDSGFFTGLTTAELWLIRAECEARAGETEKAMDDLNTLLVKRWKGAYTPLTAASSQEALAIVLAQRRKELVNRGTRWTDLRRLNQDPAFAITLRRIVGGTVYELPPDDPRYVFPIPDDEISASGIEQNER